MESFLLLLLFLLKMHCTWWGWKEKTTKAKAFEEVKIGKYDTQNDIATIKQTLK